MSGSSQIKPGLELSPARTNTGVTVSRCHSLQHGQSERTRAGKAQGSKETSSGECLGQSILC